MRVLVELDAEVLLEVDVVSCAPTSRIEMELVANFVFAQPELKFSQKPELLKSVMLTHIASSSHDCWHAARSETLPDD